VKVLVLGGTGEARELAAALDGEPGLEVVSSLAGRLREPVMPVGETRVGGFGGADGLTAWLRDERIDAVVDATHPFAANITESAVTACGRTGVPLLVLRRPGWSPGPGDDWHWVATPAAAAEAVADLGERVFLTIGRSGLAAFAGLSRHWFLIRAVDPPQPPLPARMRLVLDRGPFTEDGERELFAAHRIQVLVTKDSGGPMTAAKLVVARERGLPVVVQARPAAPDAETVPTVDEAVSWLDALNV
jgi:precorrin-6A/cobalt-precorrin-6A reductase